MCLDYISQRNTDQPQNDDLVTDILSRSVLFYFLPEPVENIPTQLTLCIYIYYITILYSCLVLLYSCLVLFFFVTFYIVENCYIIYTLNVKNTI